MLEVTLLQVDAQDELVALRNHLRLVCLEAVVGRASRAAAKFDARIRFLGLTGDADIQVSHQIGSFPPEHSARSFNDCGAKLQDIRCLIKSYLLNRVGS